MLIATCIMLVSLFLVPFDHIYTPSMTITGTGSIYCRYIGSMQKGGLIRQKRKATMSVRSKYLRSSVKPTGFNLSRHPFVLSIPSGYICQMTFLHITLSSDNGTENNSTFTRWPTYRVFTCFFFLREQELHVQISVRNKVLLFPPTHIICLFA